MGARVKILGFHGTELNDKCARILSFEGEQLLVEVHHIHYTVQDTCCKVVSIFAYCNVYLHIS